ncbi:hypothetical protein DNTS_016529 [Danionella cerebrum]|uniref:Sec23/Sec24 trunk domain-containing protein n=1 Tax=Danionella cerebrum TaxID=2873325 RepID=A0A553RAW9_9TELE|nr:hypothetical protein DNTS_016529 [Danionella translucida]
MNVILEALYKMEIPALNQSYTHQSQQSWTTFMAPVATIPNHHLNLIQDQRRADGSVTSVVSSSEQRPQTIHWDPTIQSDSDVYKPGSEITNASTQGMLQRSYSLPTSPVSNKQTESRYGLDPQLLPSVLEVPVCDAGDCVKGCGHCGAFMSPAMSWQDCGQRFYCPFCDKLTEGTWFFFLLFVMCHGSLISPLIKVVELTVKKNLSSALALMKSLRNRREVFGKGAVLLLAIDVSATALRTGQLDHMCQQICAQLQALNGPKEIDQSELRVGLMTYDKRIHLYDLSPALSRPHMMVITDCEELELPVMDGLLVSLRECMHIIERVLHEIVLFIPESEEVPSSQELAVSAGLKILQARSIFHGPDSSVSLAKECISEGCCVHMFVFSHQEVGGAWPGHIPFLTGGGLFCYRTLQSEIEQERFQADLSRCLDMQVAYKAQLKVFVSKEMQISGCYGSILTTSDSCCVAMAAIDGRTALAFEFTHNKSLEETRGVSIQFVLSYNNYAGERRIRIHTVMLSASHQLLDTFRSSQAETLLTFYCKKMYSLALESPLQCLREELQTEVTEMLACFRKHSCTPSVSPGQLVLPQFLKALCVYINSLRKSEVLLPGLRSSVHQRLLQRSLTISMDTASMASLFYPLIQPLSVGAENSTTPLTGEAVRSTVSSLHPCGVYLIYSPLALLLWVGSAVAPYTLLQLFNTNSISCLMSGELKLVLEGDNCEDSLQRLLVEDKSPNGGASYADFLFHLHVNVLRLIV